MKCEMGLFFQYRGDKRLLFAPAEVTRRRCEMRWRRDKSHI